MNVTIEKYKGGRHWAVYLNGTLLCLTVYRKGAEAIREVLT